MDDYFMDQIISSYEECFWGGDSCGNSYDYYNDFTRDPNFYHYRVRFTIIHETAKAYLFEVKEGQFWCPKSLLRNVKIKNSDLRGLLWEDFKPKFIPKQTAEVDDFDIEPEPITQKPKIELSRVAKLPKPKKKKKKKKTQVTMLSTPTGNNDVFKEYDLDWLR